MKCDLVDAALRTEFKEWASTKSSIDRSHPLFLMLLHEADTLPAAKFSSKNIKTLNKGFPDLSFSVHSNNFFTIEDHRNNLKISLDKYENVTYDHNRRAVRAIDDENLLSICSKLHKRVRGILQQLFQKDERYQAFQSFDKRVGSALLTLKGAQRQPVHCDTSLVEGLSALVAMLGPFKFILFENSVQLIRRIAQIRAEWIHSGSPIPPEISRSDQISTERWYDDAVFAQLRREGWGTSKILKARTIHVPEGAALVFSSWLLHAGHEFTAEDLQLFNRIHLYLLPYSMGSNYDTINMHRTMVQKTGLSFSPALHFLPRPQEPHSAVALPYLFGSLYNED